MGCVMSVEEDSFARDRNTEIERQINADRSKLRNRVKILLLGAGECGKSTILKQMRLIYRGSYSEHDRNQFKEAIFTNTVQSMKILLQAVDTLGLTLDGEDRSKAEIIMTQPPAVETLSPEVTDAIAALWQHSSVRQCLKRSNEYQLNDSAEYMFDNVKRIGGPDYVPNDQDILQVRVKTTGITEVEFNIGNLNYHVFDMGGQRSERKKWIHCFEDVTAILYIVALSEYDQSLSEDFSVNRMTEALSLFDSICNSTWFISTPIILFMNKTDIFREKIKVRPMERFFCDYKGGPSFSAASKYLLGRFVSLNRDDSKQIYPHFTCATDTKQVGVVLDTVHDIILQEVLEETGLL